MSTIRVDNFGPSSGGTTYSAQGISKAWFWVNDPPSLVSSMNCSSITDITTGGYEVNITSGLTSVYGATALNALRTGIPVASAISGGSMSSTTAVRVRIQSDTFAAADCEFTGVLHGVLA